MPITSPKAGRSRCQPMPAPGEYSITSACSSASGSRPGIGRARPRWKQEVGDAARLLQAAAVEVVAPAERHGATLAEEAVELERAKRQVRQISDQRPLLVGRDHVRRIAHAVRQIATRAEQVALVLDDAIFGHGCSAHDIYICTGRSDCIQAGGSPYAPDTRNLPDFVAPCRRFCRFAGATGGRTISSPMNPKPQFHPAVAAWFAGTFPAPTPAQARGVAGDPAGRTR